MQKQKLVLITGANAAGKDTAASYISTRLEQDHALVIPVAGISTPLRTHFTERGIEPTRQDLIDYNQALTAKYGEAVLAQLALRQHSEPFMLTGLRQPKQLSYLKTQTDILHIAILTEAKNRYDRSIKAGKKGVEVTLDAFIESERRENSPPNSQRVEYIIQQAEHTVPNDETIQEFYLLLSAVLPTIYDHFKS